jgi:hypothetical protein
MIETTQNWEKIALNFPRFPPVQIFWEVSGHQVTLRHSKQRDALKAMKNGSRQCQRASH